MPYDAALAARVRAAVTAYGTTQRPVVEKPMFGGLGFMLGDHLAVCVGHEGDLLVRVAEDDGPALLARAEVEPMRMGGRASRTWLRVSPAGLGDDDVLGAWVARGAAIAAGLAPKTRPPA